MTKAVIPGYIIRHISQWPWRAAGLTVRICLYKSDMKEKKQICFFMRAMILFILLTLFCLRFSTQSGHCLIGRIWTRNWGLAVSIGATIEPVASINLFSWSFLHCQLLVSDWVDISHTTDLFFWPYGVGLLAVLQYLQECSGVSSPGILVVPREPARLTSTGPAAWSSSSPVFIQ